ncbi:sulfurtransferase complex subunit TusD [Pseudoalteromonas citrea]|uniref:Sulfurtransferase complex subunit TusD n=1 Tax=Pseudoalteromonas citrea TaxID=43655 RepID=A0A5S3XJM5_9GAMM|nr:sulfurtransferase complex subunit TusD [Pseudoalteromonas citrea]TMP41932.1 sulfurtransferase complex subunit TusD [Pseudoalteromonas citrea]TMP54490.1 sulfurtransferase complex subunit TusD [Pseudoalteromonas citrea]
MSKFVLSLHSGVSDHLTLHNLSRFAHAALSQGHEIPCIFLYQDGVYHASQSLQLASDELNVSAIWQSLSNEGISLILCVTAAEKRGIDTKNTGIFKVAGLAEFAMLSAQSDKWVQFK